GRRLFAFDPALAGRPWRIDSAPLDDVFILEQNHGGQTRLAECPKYEAVQRVMSQCRPPVDGRPGWIGELARAVDRARTCVLYNGGVAATADAICDRLGA